MVAQSHQTRKCDTQFLLAMSTHWPGRLHWSANGKLIDNDWRHITTIDFVLNEDIAHSSSQTNLPAMVLLINTARYERNTGRIGPQ